MRPIAVVGNLSLDVVDGGPPRIGGAPYYAARALRLLARRAAIVARCADEDRGALLPRLAALGVPVTMLSGRATARFAIDYDGEARTLHVLSAGDEWTPDDLGTAEPVLRRCDWVHAAPLLYGDFPEETLAALARGRRLSLDGQGLVRPRDTGPLELRAGADATLDSVTALKLAEEEAVALVGDVSEAALRGLGVREVLVTLGSRGSLVLAGRRLERVRAHAIPADPTGAGDAFCAAYVAGRSDGLAPAAAARRATALVARLLTRRR